MPTVTLIPCSTSATSPAPPQVQEELELGPCLPKLHSLRNDLGLAETGDDLAASRGVGVGTGANSGISITGTGAAAVEAEAVVSSPSSLVMFTAVTAPWSETPRSTLLGGFAGSGGSGRRAEAGVGV